MAQPTATTERVAPLPARPALSDREPTAEGSTAQLNDPAWVPSLGDKLRLYRYASVPGWFDRIDGRGLSLPEGPIAGVRDTFDQAILRRQIAGGVAIHTTIVTLIVAICVHAPAIANALRTVFTAPWMLDVVAASLLVQLVALKLVLDFPRLRVMVFSLYTLSLSVTLALLQFLWEAPHDTIVCSVVVAFTTVVYVVLCGALYKGSFLSFATLWFVVSLVAEGGLAIATSIPNTFTPDGSIVGIACILLVVTYVLVYETLEFLSKLQPSEAPLGVYILHIDIAAVTIYAVRMACFFTAGLMACSFYCAYEPVVAVVHFACGRWRDVLERTTCDSFVTCSLDCNCKQRPRAAQVAVDTSASDDGRQSAIAAIADTQIDR